MKRTEFGTDGIRGLVGEWPWHKPIIMRIGQALGEFIRVRSPDLSVVAGHDTRSSSADFLGDLCTGMMGQGITVINLGIMTTPGVAFLTRRVSAALGVVVSASHSPLEYNGIKLVGANGLRLQREDEIEIENLIDRVIMNSPKYVEVLGQEINGRHLVEIYLDDHVKKCPSPSLEDFSIVLDCANGATSKLAPEVFRRVGCGVVVINDSPDGNNINYRSGSEYVRAYPDELVSVVRQAGANYGFAFDGDGDRLVVVDRHGQVFDGEDLLFTLGLYYNEMGLLKNKTIVTTYLANRGLEEALLKFGIRIVYANKGDRNLEAAMWKGDYMLGGEIGGNIIINDGYHTAADAIYTALVLAGILVQRHDIRLSGIVAQMRKYPQEILSFAMVKNPSSLINEKIEETIRELSFQLGEGSRILFWESSTERQIFRVLVEGGIGSTKEDVTKIAQFVRQIIEGVAK
jgi:phosphoglucosamine mutase